MIKVISGKFRGKRIPFSASANNADITTQILKEAFFSIIQNCNREAFLDLFACSGQIGIEACSRGFFRVDMVEVNGRRFNLLKKNVSDFGLDSVASVYNIDAFLFLDKIRFSGLKYDVVYIDPPYEKHGTSVIYPKILAALSPDNLNSDSVIAIQHYHLTSIDTSGFPFVLQSVRKYGTNCLSLLSLADDKK